VILLTAVVVTRNAEVEQIDPPLVDLLTQVPLFSALDGDELTHVARFAVPREFERGHVIFRQGEQSETCYVVCSGRARALREHHEGRVITLASFGPGDLFGELALLEAEPRSATVEAVEQLRVLALPGADMRRLIVAHSEIAIHLLIGLAARLREANERIVRQSFQTVASRVAGALAEQVAIAQLAGAGATDVRVTATQADLGRLAGASRESVSRFMATLERAGLITQGRGRVTVHDPQALEGYVF
jgi:CRP/FNR family transcriptional regulator